MNWFGLRVSGRVQLVIAFVLGGLLLAATLVSLPHADSDNLTPFAPHGWLAVGSAAALLVWAFAGWEAVTSLSGEYRNPARDIGRATGIAIGGHQRALPRYRVRDRRSCSATTPARRRCPTCWCSASARRPGRSPTVVAVLLSVGAINAYFAGGARLGAALARDGSLPAWLAQGSSAGRGAPPFARRGRRSAAWRPWR